jgi:predicted dehydrogenase
VTRIGIVGGGRAATLHAEAALATAGADLVGVGGRPGTAGPLAEAAMVPDLSLEDLIARADGLVIAVAADAAADVVDRLPPDLPVLVESPVRLTATRSAGVPPSAMTAVNLLHARTVKQGLRAIGDLGEVHHLALRGRAIRRQHATDLFSEPFAGAWPVLLMAAGAAAVSVSATRSGPQAAATVTLSDGRAVTATLEWVESAPGDLASGALTELEAAGATGVVNIGLWPVPTLELDGRAVTRTDDHPLVALGFIEQMRRFVAVCDGRAEPWPPLGVGIGVTALTRAAGLSAAQDGASVDI